jgi:hypothetical protein
MSCRIRLLALVAAVWFATGSDLLACGDKFLVAGRGTRYQRPKNARSADVVIYADPASGFPTTVGSVPVESVLKREGHRLTTVGTLEQLATILAGGRFDVVVAAASVVSAVERLLGATPDAPAVVALCVKPARPAPAGDTPPCAVKAPVRERSLLEAIDKAVLRRDKNVRRTAIRG